ncbi:adapter protein CIKS [Parambassis ranga]|uniref:E3 ubiquitin ligase TRAF3IP2 n=1 Tax=Parambassis ranga TaxID=210632 RepID=A0A6P7HZQ6_9TELE|nr:adapter protein CIKS [Parambassis ranga]
MDSSKGPCPHQSIPVEMDERMTASSLDLHWLPNCTQCSGHTESRQRPEARGCEPLPDRQCQDEPRETFYPALEPSGHMRPPHPADIWTRGLGERAPLYQEDFVAEQRIGVAGPSDWARDHSVEEAESLEPPFSLLSYNTYTPRYPMSGHNQVHGSSPRKCPCCSPPNRLNNYFPNNPHHPAGPRQEPHRHHQQLNLPQRGLQHEAAPAPLVPRGHESQRVVPQRELMQEVSVGRSFPAGTGGVTREVRRTVSLPEECRKLFITYSVDTAEDMLPFVKFLSDHGFKPSIDLFDSPMRRMGINKWMDGFLNDKSVLIIVVISPKYREDVEGVGDDEHGLHTKYIHNQIQNEFIQQGCLNFRLVPVLFPNATKEKHVPQWLRSTRIYRWPHDTEDLLLRLLREERYIIPQRGADLTLTVRAL